MRNYRKTTYMAILGLTVGSAVTVLINGIRGVSNVASADMTSMIIQCIVCAAIGALLGLGLTRLAHMYADSKEE